MWSRTSCPFETSIPHYHDSSNQSWSTLNPQRLNVGAWLIREESTDMPGYLSLSHTLSRSLTHSRPLSLRTRAANQRADESAIGQSTVTARRRTTGLLSTLAHQPPTHPYRPYIPTFRTPAASALCPAKTTPVPMHYPTNHYRPTLYPTLHPIEPRPYPNNKS